MSVTKIETARPFDPRAHARDILATTDLADPDEIAQMVFEATPKRQMPDLYRTLLREVVMEAIRFQRAESLRPDRDAPTDSDRGQVHSDAQNMAAPVAPAPRANPSSRIAAIRGEFAQRVRTGDGYKLLRDCTLAEVLEQAALRRTVAAKNEAVAKWYDDLAARMEAAGVDIVGDLEGKEVAA